MAKLIHTPYDGSSKPFTIGLQQLDPAHWIEPDGELGYHLAEKCRLFAEHGDQVFRAEPDTEPAQQEILDSLIGYLPAHHPEIYRRDSTVMEMAGHRVDLADEALPPLHRAGLLVQDDLVIMRRGENGWRIAAAFLAFPSSWSLTEKFGRTMDEIHAPVPDFQGGSRNADLINRMFDNLSPGRFVVRWNWSMNWTYALYMPAPLPAAEALAARPEQSFARIERQTLRKLPVSGDILFTIRIYLDPIKAIMAQPDGAALASSFAEQLEALTPAQAGYKGLTAKRAALIGLLRMSAETPALAESAP
jgi:hypothetical protein